MANEPKFRKGQKVLLTSRTAPQLNGVHVISSVTSFDDGAILEHTGQPFSGYSYQLEGVPGDWAEHCLQVMN